MISEENARIGSDYKDATFSTYVETLYPLYKHVRPEKIQPVNEHKAKLLKMYPKMFSNHHDDIKVYYRQPFHSGLSSFEFVHFKSRHMYLHSKS